MKLYFNFISCFPACLKYFMPICSELCLLNLWMHFISCVLTALRHIENHVSMHVESFSEKLALYLQFSVNRKYVTVMTEGKIRGGGWVRQEGKHSRGSYYYGLKTTQMKS